ncbi:MAG: hypothetical protein DRP94_09285 [Candidatus Latescibacterota bacterium]|nr:MAG: hypothetical protein DRP94_09285 [Candidatus Latescibacterota bacterium]RKY63365.1 MAG: hypothetical protein DRQ08_09795 [Candidatus Latescibacterota bacterium]
MTHKKTVLSVPPSFLEVEQMARYYAKGRGIPFSAFVWQAVEHYLREQLGEEELPDEVLMELDAIEEEMDRGEYVSLEDL